MEEIRSSTVLPGNREDVEIHTVDSEVLVGELSVPAVGEPLTTLIMLHALPTCLFYTRHPADQLL